MFGELEEFSLKYMEMFWWHQHGLPGNPSLCGMDVPIMKLPGYVPWVSYSFVQAMLLLRLEIISLRLAWICLHMMQSHF